MNCYKNNRALFLNTLQFDIELAEEPYTVTAQYSKEENIPVLQVSMNPNLKTLNSLYSVKKELERWADSIKSSDVFIVIGLGTGLQIQLLKHKFPDSLILIIEPELPFLKTLSRYYQFYRYFTDSSVRMLQASNNLQENLVCGIHNNISCIVTPGYMQFIPEYVSELKELIANEIDAFLSDTVTQRKVAFFLYKNVLSNLYTMKNTSRMFELKNTKPVFVAGGGPSLNNIVNSYSTDHFLIAADTALPFLHAHAITPNVVICLDVRNISYLNFIGTNNESLYMFDIGYPPFITRKFQNKLFFTSNFPFTAFFNEQGGYLPILDTSCGNVGSLAVYFASLLNPESIYTFGLDFCYLHGDPYIQESYFYRYLHDKHNRVDTYYSKVFSFMSTYTLDYNKSTKHYTTPLMKSYKERTHAMLKRKGYTYSNDNSNKLVKKNNTAKKQIQLMLRNIALSNIEIEEYMKNIETLQSETEITHSLTGINSTKLKLLFSVSPLLTLFPELPLKLRIRHAISLLMDILKKRNDSMIQ